MKIKNLFLASLLTLASLQIQSSDAQEQEVQEEVAVEVAPEVAPVAVVNPIPESVQPKQASVMQWALAGSTPEEKAERAALLIALNYVNHAQKAILQRLIDAVTPAHAPEVVAEAEVVQAESSDAEAV